MSDDFLIYLIVFVIASIGISYFAYIFYDLKEKAEKVINLKEQLEDALDRRFKIFEYIINVISSKLDYEQTILKEIVQLRSYSQSLKEHDDTKSQFETEEKISKICDLVFEAYPDIKKLNNFEELKKENSLVSHNIETMKNEYNNSVELYNRKKHSTTGTIVSNIFKSKTYFIFDYWPTAKNRNYYNPTKLKI